MTVQPLWQHPVIAAIDALIPFLVALAIVLATRFQ
jgi:hypothetical protein